MNEAFNILSAIEIACLQAGRYQHSMEAQARIVECNRKFDLSLVTEVDIESEKIIRQSLSKLGQIVGEETPASHSLLGTDANFFLVDPLDGTTSFRRFAGTEAGQVGYGPLVSWCEKGKIICACFYSLPNKTLFSAVKGEGVRMQKFDSMESPLLSFASRIELKQKTVDQLSDCGLLFHSVSGVELPLIANLVRKRSVENAYRFGGFANDAVRLAQGYEQIQIQYSVKAWDFSATLFEIETGYSIILDPSGKKINYNEWQVALENPLIVAPQNLIEEVLKIAFN